MPIAMIQRVRARYAPTGSGTVNIGQMTPYETVIGCTARVIVAGSGSGTVSFGAGGTPAGMMTTGDVASGVTGRKLVASGSLLPGNGYTPGGVTALTATYTKGTDVTTPVIEVVYTIIRKDVLDRLFVK